MFSRAIKKQLSAGAITCVASLLLSVSYLALAQVAQAEEMPRKAQIESAQVASWLAQADHYRLPLSVAKSVTRVEVFENHQLSSENLYHVYSQTDKRSLVVFKSDREQGQKMLMLQEQYWLLMPNSKRPIRITPMQKLLGQASVGDISTMTWSQDYEATRVVEQASDIAEAGALKLVLKAKAGNSNYQSIELWLKADNAFPVRANLYLKSGKLAKTAYFEADQAQQRVKTMRLIDGFQPDKVTLIHYEQHEAISLEDKFYNPAYLIRQNLSEF